MFQQFIDRSDELKILEERYKSNKPEFLIIYGRRRIGKTELVLKFIKNKPNIYFLAEEKRDIENRNEMQSIMGNFLNDDEFKLIKFDNWTSLFKSFLKRTKKRTIIVIDEFPYLIKQNPAVPSEFQKIWDLSLSKSNMILILIGSSISMMEKLLGEKSPLHGRRTGQLEINPINIFEIKKFLPMYKIEDCINVYGCVDCIPLYLKQFRGSLSFYENVKNIFLNRDKLLYSEAEILLRQEFRETANYFSILKAISFGYTRHSEIVSYTDLDKTIISKYIQNLEKVRIIKREYPVTERKEKRKNARYIFTDNYFRFWFRFIYPNKTIIERGEAEQAIKILKQNYNSYLGLIFEEVVKEFLWRTKPFQFQKIGRWWYKDKEIDLVMLNEQTKDIAFFECKWKKLGYQQCLKILEELKEKASFVEWFNEKRKEHYGIIAKKIENKEDLRKKDYLIYDLDDWDIK